MTNDQHYMTAFDSRVGELTLVATDTGLRAVLWPTEKEGRVPLVEEIASMPEHPVLSATRAQLEEYFRGERTEFDLPLDLRGTDFQKSAWLALATIPFGETATYGEQAERIGKPAAVRAIGAANGRNPISIILPCHRVVGANGDLTGFAGGIETKRDLLAFEKRANGANVQGVLELV